MTLGAPATVMMLLAAVSAAEPPAPITTAGWGRVRVGTSRLAASRALGGDLRLAEGTTDASGCHYRTSTQAPGLLFMIENGRVVRVETESAAYATLSGVRVGDSEASARDTYAGRAVITPHKYAPGGSYLTIRTADRRRAVVIETSDGKVVAIRGGQLPAVEYVEGCS